MNWPDSQVYPHNQVACVHALCLRGRGLLPDAETSSEERTSKTVSMATVEIELKRERFEGGKK